jgi:hypothetical protein
MRQKAGGRRGAARGGQGGGSSLVVTRPCLPGWVRSLEGRLCRAGGRAVRGAVPPVPLMPALPAAVLPPSVLGPNREDFEKKIWQCINKCSCTVGILTYYVAT